MSEETPYPVNPLVPELPIGSRFTVMVDGVAVDGEIVSRWRRDIEVRLLTPIGHVGASCSVPYFAAPFVDYDGPAGAAKARELLPGCYRKAVVFDRHKDELARRWLAHQELVERYESRAPDRPEALRADRLESRRRLRAGEIDQRAFQALLETLRKRARVHEGRLREMCDEFMAATPWDGPEDLGGIVPFLKGIGMI